MNYYNIWCVLDDDDLCQGSGDFEGSGNNLAQEGKLYDAHCYLTGDRWVVFGPHRLQ